MINTPKARRVINRIDTPTVYSDDRHAAIDKIARTAVPTLPVAA